MTGVEHGLPVIGGLPKPTAGFGALLEMQQHHAVTTRARIRFAPAVGVNPTGDGETGVEPGVGFAKPEGRASGPVQREALKREGVKLPDALSVGCMELLWCWIHDLDIVHERPKYPHGNRLHFAPSGRDQEPFAL